MAHSFIKNTLALGYRSRIQSSNALALQAIWVTLLTVWPMVLLCPIYSFIMRFLTHGIQLMMRLPFHDSVPGQIIYTSLLIAPVFLYHVLLFYIFQVWLDGETLCFRKIRVMFSRNSLVMLLCQVVVLAILVVISWFTLVPFLFPLLLFFVPFLFVIPVFLFLEKTPFLAIKRCFKIVKKQYFSTLYGYVKGLCFFTLLIVCLLGVTNHYFDLLHGKTLPLMIDLVGFLQVNFITILTLLLLHQAMLKGVAVPPSDHNL